MTIKNRRYAREEQNTLSATHEIRVGGVSGPEDGRKLPTRLKGFLVTQGRRANGYHNICYDIMAALGYDAATVKTAYGQHSKAPDDCLPTSLAIAIASNAVRDGDGWRFPGMHNETYAYWKSDGGTMRCECSGDGETASRLQSDGSRQEIECVPVGRAGAEPESFCPYSVKNDCKDQGGLIVILMELDQSLADDNPDLPTWRFMRPLRAAGDARFRFRTTSEHSLIQIAGELENAAEVLDGKLYGLRGTLHFSMRKTVTGTGQSTKVPFVQLRLNIEMLSAMAEQRREVERLPSPMRQLPPPPPTRRPAPVAAPAHEPDDDFADTAPAATIPPEIAAMSDENVTAALIAELDGVDSAVPQTDAERRVMLAGLWERGSEV